MVYQSVKVISPKPLTGYNFHQETYSLLPHISSLTSAGRPELNLLRKKTPFLLHSSMHSPLHAERLLEATKTTANVFKSH